MKSIAYLRVSSDQQAENGMGLDAQLEACKRYANGTLAEVYKDEGISGAKSLEDRPGLLEAVGSLQNGDKLVVAKRDRIGRDPLVVAMIEATVHRKGATIVSAAGEGTENDDPSSILMRRMVDAFAEYERLIISARTKAVFREMKRQGKRTGSVPYGYTADEERNLHWDPEEQKVMRTARWLRQKGHTLRGIAKGLAERGMHTRKGGEWGPQQIKQLLEE